MCKAFSKTKAFGTISLSVIFYHTVTLFRFLNSLLKYIWGCVIKFKKLTMDFAPETSPVKIFFPKKKC